MEMLGELMARWDHRDKRYRLRREGLSDAEVAAIRTFRRDEAFDLDDDARDAALRAVIRWAPPALESRRS